MIDFFKIIDGFEYSPIVESIRTYVRSIKDLEKYQYVLENYYSSRQEDYSIYNVANDFYWSDDFYEISENREYALNNLIASISLVKINNKIEDLKQKIARLLKLITTLRTKLIQLKRLNKRTLFRSKVNLIFKNLDDSHLGFELFQLKNNSIHLLTIFKYYLTCTIKTMNLSSC